jgi:hypothetical protein
MANGALPHAAQRRPSSSLRLLLLKDYASFRKTRQMRTDTSNNTVYADDD